MSTNLRCYGASKLHIHVLCRFDLDSFHFRHFLGMVLFLSLLLKRQQKQSSSTDRAMIDYRGGDIIYH